MTEDSTIETDSGNEMFVSYASQDVAVATSIVEPLERQRIRCWMAPRDVQPGAVYAEAIVRAINDSKAMVLVLSANAMASAHVGREVEGAASKRKPIIAFRIDTAPLSPELEYFLSNSQWIDVPALGMPAALTKLTEAVSQIGAKRVPNQAPLTPAVSGKGRRIAVATVIVGVIVAAALGWHSRWLNKNGAQRQAGAATPESAAASAPAIPAKSIAVLPFVDMSEKKDQEYFADGIAEEVLDRLAKVPGLRVVGHASSIQFQGKNADPVSIGAALGVTYLLEGSVRKEGGRVRVAAQLVEVRTGS